MVTCPAQAKQFWNHVVFRTYDAPNLKLCFPFSQLRSVFTGRISAGCRTVPPVWVPIVPK